MKTFHIAFLILGTFTSLSYAEANSCKCENGTRPFLMFAAVHPNGDYDHALYLGESFQGASASKKREYTGQSLNKHGECIGNLQYDKADLLSAARDELESRHERFSDDLVRFIHNAVSCKFKKLLIGKEAFNGCAAVTSGPFWTDFYSAAQVYGAGVYECQLRCNN